MGKSKKSARDTKQMKAKDRLTVILHVNATGTCKISPTVIKTANDFDVLSETLQSYRTSTKHQLAQMLSSWIHQKEVIQFTLFILDITQFE